MNKDKKKNSSKALGYCFANKKQMHTKPNLHPLDMEKHIIDEKNAMIVIV